MTLFWHPAGGMLMYLGGFLEIADLNPEVKAHWRMSRMDMLKLGWRCIVAAALDKEAGND
jgi:hypothetical protein